MKTSGPQSFHSEALGLIAVNGVIAAPEAAVLPALDRGFLFGDNIFETFVGLHGQLLGVAKHLARLRRSADALMMSLPWSDAELTFELQALAEQMTHPKLNIRLVVTRGSGMGLRIPKDAKPNRLVYCFKANEEPLATYREGFALKRVAKGSTERGAAPKTGNYVASVMALERAEREGCQDILWTNADGEVTEASASNIFFMARTGDNVELVTPPAMSGILLGITRDDHWAAEGRDDPRQRANRLCRRTRAFRRSIFVLHGARFSAR